MWVRLLKGYTNKRKKRFHIGKILNVSRETYKDLTSRNIAEDYIGEIPPKKKIKTQFFKPKEKWH